MQDRYFGDVGDFGKYGLLRVLCGTNGQRTLKLGIVWYLFPNESHNSDGKYIGYLQVGNPQFRNCDESLYDRLRTLLFDDLGIVENNRCLKSAEASGLLPEGTVFYAQPLSYEPGDSNAARKKLREDWFSASLAKTAPADLVFLDPDNGIECESVARTGKNGPKYVYWDDIDAFVGRGQSVVIYHHLNRAGSHLEQVESKLAVMRGRYQNGFESSAVTFRRGTSRAYFILASPRDKDILGQRIVNLVSSAWSRHFIAHA